MGQAIQVKPVIFEGALAPLDDLQSPTLLLGQGVSEFPAFVPGIGNDGGDGREGCLQSDRQQGFGAPVGNISGLDAIGDR